MADIDFTTMQQEIQAMADKFGTTTDGLADFIKVTSKGTKEFKKQLDDLNKEIKKGKAGYAQQKQVLENLNTALEEFGDTLGDEDKIREKNALISQRDTLAHSAMMRGVTEDVTMAVSKTTVGLVVGAGQFVKGLQANQSAAALSGELFKVGIDVAAVGMKTAGGMAEKFGDKMMNSANPFVAAIGVVTSGVGMLAQASAETAAKLAKFGVDVLQAEVEKTTKAFNSMSASGALFADGMTGMRNASIGAGLTVEQFSGVLKEQSANIATAGLGVTEGAKAVGRVGSDLKKSGVQQQLMKLGYGFEEQAGLIAETMANIRRSGGGNKATDAQVAEQTQKYAENLRLIASITGEDAKKKEAEAAESSKELAFRQKLAGKSVEQQAQINAAMATMTTLERKNFTDRVVLGGVINQEGAIYESTISGAREKGDKLAALFNQNNLNAKTAAEANAQYGAQITKSGLAQEGIAVAGHALGGQLGDVSKGIADVIDNNNKYTKEGVKAAEAANKAAGKTTDGLTNGVISAEVAAQDLKTALQDVLTPAIMDYAKVSKAMLQSIKDAMVGLGYGSKEDMAKAAPHGAGAGGSGAIIPNNETTRGFYSGLVPDETGKFLVRPKEEKKEEPVNANPWGAAYPGVGKAYANGGIASGPVAGFTAELHGTEAVVPLPDGKTIPVKLDSSSLNAAMQEQTGLLHSILVSMDKGNHLTSGILQNSM